MISHAVMTRKSSNPLKNKRSNIKENGIRDFISYGPLLIIIKHVGNKLNVHVVVILFFQGFRLCHRPIFKEKIFLFFFLLATKFRSLHTISIYSIDAPWLVHGQTGWTASFTIKTET